MTKKIKTRLNGGADRKQFLSHDAENEITITAFRLLTMDLIALYFVMNEGTMSVLGKVIEAFGSPSLADFSCRTLP